MLPYFDFAKFERYFECDIFSCPGTSIPDLGQSVSQSVTHCHFRIWTQRVTFKTEDPSDIWSECLKKTKIQKDKKTKQKKTKRQKDKKSKSQKDKKTKIQKHD